MFNPATVKLGKLPVKHDPRTLRLARYFTAELPPPPPSRIWSNGLADWGMFANDTLGDCTIAGIPHGIMGWTMNTGVMATFTAAQAISYYMQWDGYNPANPATDQGGVCLDVLKDWKAQGFAGHQIAAFASVLPANQQHVMQAINLFGGLYTGVALPMTAQAQVGGLWDVVPPKQKRWFHIHKFGVDPSTPGSWGGHCVWIIDYDAIGPTCVTWGALQKMTWAYWSKYFDEAYAIISPDFINAAGMAPNGFALADLESDVTQIN